MYKREPWISLLYIESIKRNSKFSIALVAAIGVPSAVLEGRKSWVNDTFVMAYIYFSAGFEVWVSAKSFRCEAPGQNSGFPCPVLDFERRTHLPDGAISAE